MKSGHVFLTALYIFLFNGISWFPQDHSFVLSKEVQLTEDVQNETARY